MDNLRLIWEKDQRHKTLECSRCQDLAAELAKVRQEMARLQEELAKAKGQT